MICSIEFVDPVLFKLQKFSTRKTLSGKVPANNCDLGYSNIMAVSKSSMYYLYVFSEYFVLTPQYSSWQEKRQYCSMLRR